MTNSFDEIDLLFHKALLLKMCYIIFESPLMEWSKPRLFNLDNVLWLLTAPGKHRVSTPISRARVICPRASFVPENLWEEITRARHLVNDARICGTNFWREMTRASKFSKLPDFQNFAWFSKFSPILVPQIRASFTKWRARGISSHKFSGTNDARGQMTRARQIPPKIGPTNPRVIYKRRAPVKWA